MDARLLTALGAYALPRPPEFVQQVQRKGGIVAYYKRYGRFPGEIDADQE
jgi:methanogen homoaconitase small subunit